MAASATFGLMVIALTIVLVVGLAIVVWSVFRRSPYREACCGACRYAVEGLEGMTCPECGSDLRRVGIMVPGMRRETGAVTRSTVMALVWTCLMAIVWVMANTLVSNLVPGNMTIQGSTQFVRPRSDGYASMSVNVDARGVARVGAAMDGEVVLTLLGHDGASVERTLRLESLWAAEARGDALEAVPRETFREMVAEIEADVDAQLLRAEIEDVAGFVARLAQGDGFAHATGFAGVTTTGSSVTSPVRWPFAVVGLSLLVVWGGGLAWIIMWGRKRRRFETERWATA